VNQVISDLAAQEPEVALTLIIPTPRNTPQAVSTHINSVLKQARDQLASQSFVELSSREQDQMLSAVQARISHLNSRYFRGSLWIGVDRVGNVEHYKLDAELEPFVHVGSHYHLYALARQVQSEQDALVLLLSEPGAELVLYHAARSTVEERFDRIENFGFPFVFPGEDARRDRSTGSHQRDERYRRWLRHVLQGLSQAKAEMPSTRQLPVVAVGIGRYLGFLGEISKDTPFDVAVETSPDSVFDAELDPLIQNGLAEYRKAEVQQNLGLFFASLSTHRATSGTDAKNAASMGRVRLLLVENHAIRQEANMDAILHVYRFGGDVLEVPNGSLRHYGPSAAVLRW